MSAPRLEKRLVLKVAVIFGDRKDSATVVSGICQMVRRRAACGYKGSTAW